jgi:hypothetical protein
MKIKMSAGIELWEKWDEYESAVVWKRFKFFWIVTEVKLRSEQLI